MNILIVEDEYIIGLDLKLFLKSLGHTIIGVTGYGEEAIKIALRDKPDIILMDINLDGKLTGIEAALEIIKGHKCKIIFITGQSDPYSLQQIEKTGWPIMFKPYDKLKLENFIDN